MSNSFDPSQWRWNSQQDTSQDAFRVNSVQSFIDAARREGIRLGLEAAAKEIVERQELASNCPDGGSEYLRTDHMLADIRALDPETIAKEADNEPR